MRIWSGVRTHGKLSSIAMIVLMVMGSGWIVLAEPAGDASRASRGGDNEPNDVYTSASLVTGNEVVDGSLGTSSPGDNTDFYKIDGGVAPFKVITVTLYHVDFNESNPSGINFNVAILYEYYTNYLYRRANVTSTNRTEVANYFQINKVGSPEQLWICVTRVSGSLAGRYQLAINVSDPADLPVGQVSEYLDQRTGPQNAYYKLLGVNDNAGFRLRVQCPSTGYYALNIFNIWPPRDEWWPQNFSAQNTMGCLQEARIVGMGGTYYVNVSTPSYWYNGGNGTFTLTVDAVGGAEDADNFPSTAGVIASNEPYYGYIASGVDTADWWRVDAKENQTISGVSMTTPTLGYYNYINFSAFDKDFNYIIGGRASSSYTTVNLGSFTMNYTGPLYFAVRAGYNYGSGYTYGGWGSYKLELKLPNEPPQLNGTLPAVVMDEDTTDSTLVLSDFVWDPDGDHINYTLSSSKTTITTVVDRVTGRVTFTPKPDWSGVETFKFRAQDDGPDQKWLALSTTVTVNPVNDMPVLVGAQMDAKFAEGEEWRTVDLGTIFKDIDADDPVSSFSFGCRAISATTHPPGGELPVRYDAKTRAFVLGPTHLMYGDFEFELNCTDNHPGTIPPVARFNVSVTHVNHQPALKENVSSPMAISIPERGTSSELALDSLFTDPDLPAAYANDALTYTVTGATRLSAAVTPDRKLTISAGNEQYKPGFPGMETLTLTATDKAGRNATLQVVVTVEPINDKPEVVSRQPVQGTVSLKEREKKTFVVSVSDVDTDNSALTYAWYLDGIKDAAATASSFSYEPDYSQGGLEHRVKVDISDGNSTVSEEWAVTVTDVNRPPEGSIKSPINSSKFVKGSVVTFSAEGSDPDGDKLNFTWRDGAGTVIGTLPSFTYNKLLKGSQIIRLEISDGKDSIFRDVTIEINEQNTGGNQGAPGFGAPLLVAALAVFAALAALGGRRR